MRRSVAPSSSPSSGWSAVGNVFSAIQDQVASAFFARGAADLGFFLSGGTALAEYYLQHRDSVDLDFFTRTSNVIDKGEQLLIDAAAERGIPLVETNRSPTYRELVPPEPFHAGLRKIDLVHDTSAELAPVQQFGQVRVDSLLDIAVNKLTCIISRTDVKDFVDLYYLLQGRFTLDALMALGPKKDLGFEPAILAAQLRDIEGLQSRFQDLKLRRALEYESLRDFWILTSDELIDRLTREIPRGSP